MLERYQKDHDDQEQWDHDRENRLIQDEEEMRKREMKLT